VARPVRSGFRFENGAFLPRASEKQAVIVVTAAAAHEKAARVSTSGPCCADAWPSCARGPAAPEVTRFRGTSGSAASLWCRIPAHHRHSSPADVRVGSKTGPRGSVATRPLSRRKRNSTRRLAMSQSCQERTKSVHGPLQVHVTQMGDCIFQRAFQRARLVAQFALCFFNCNLGQHAGQPHAFNWSQRRTMGDIGGDHL
jgi:hypothetical protein